jgi:hypothetical protein
MMLLRLGLTAAVELCDLPGIQQQPRYYLRNLAVDAGPRMDAAEHERYVVDETFGSVDWLSPEPVDEYRFDKVNGLLTRISLRIPEYREEDEDRVSRWLSAESTPGTLRLVEPQSFRVAPAARRWCDNREMVLLCEGQERSNAIRLRVQIAQGLHMLFLDGLYAGWIISAPESHIVSVDGEPSSRPHDQELANNLRDYLDLMVFPELDGLMEGDPRFAKALSELRERIDPSDGAVDRRIALRECIDDVVQEWFGK